MSDMTKQMEMALMALNAELEDIEKKVSRTKAEYDSARSEFERVKTAIETLQSKEFHPKKFSHSSNAKTKIGTAQKERWAKIRAKKAEQAKGDESKRPLQVEITDEAGNPTPIIPGNKQARRTPKKEEVAH